MAENTATQMNTLRTQIAEQKAELKRLEQIQKAIKKRKTDILKYGEKMDLMIEKDKIASIVWTFRHFELNTNIDCYFDLPTKRDTIKAFIKFFYKSSTAKQFKINISPHERYTAKYTFTFEEYKELFQNIYPDFAFEDTDLYNGVWDEFPLLMSNEEECNICGDRKLKADMVRFNHIVDGKKVDICCCKYDVCNDCARNINPRKCVLCRKSWTGLFWKN